MCSRKRELATCPHPKDDAVERPALIHSRAARLGGRIIHREHLAHRFPQSVWHCPDRVQIVFSLRVHEPILGRSRVLK